jgi:hypothetical protein
MIIWGGISTFSADGGHFLDTGAIYDPQGNPQWIPLLDPIRPPLRAAHTAVWTGEEMLVWGGGYRDDDLTCIFTLYRQSGGIFVPRLGRWYRMGDSNAPRGRAGHTAVWTGQEMIVWGGWDDNRGEFFGAGGRFRLQ